MKKIFALLIVVLFLYSCSKEEEKFELFSPEAFAYSMDNGWELNASCRAKGFLQKEENETFTSKLSFSVDILTPANETLQGIGEGLVDINEEEKLADTQLETQILLDSTFNSGKYIITFNVTDDLSGKTTSIKKEFELTN
jgi:hypothetical protein